MREIAGVKHFRGFGEINAYLGLKKDQAVPAYYKWLDEKEQVLEAWDSASPEMTEIYVNLHQENKAILQKLFKYHAFTKVYRDKGRVVAYEFKVATRWFARTKLATVFSSIEKTK